MMKIAFINLGRHYGGVEVYVLSLIKAWTAKGNDCVVLARNESTFYHKLMKTGFADRVIPVDFDYKSVKIARKRLRDENIRLLQVNGINSGVFASLLHLPIKRVTTVHGSAALDRAERPSFIQKLFVCLENMDLKKSYKIIAVSMAIKKMLIGRGIDANKIELIYNGIEAYEYQERDKTDEDSVKICFVGRLETVKGCECLIKALAKLKDRSFRCDIYGDGSLRKELENLAVELGIESRIEFKGFSDKIREHLDEYNILVQPSYYESFSLTVAEAMNARVFVICSDTGGMKELITDGECGMKFEVGNVEELAGKIAWAMEHPGDVSKMIENAFIKYKENYVVSVMCEKTFELFERV